MKKKKLSLALAAVMSLALLAGCAGAPSSSVPASAPASQPASAAPAGEILGENLQYDPSVPVNNGEDITIKFWYPEDVKTICEDYIGRYTAMHPNVTIESNVSPWDDYWTKLPIAITNGTGPDMFWMHNAYTDTMVPITEPLPEDVFPTDQLNADFRQVELHRIDGKLYYIDTGLMSSVVMYNKAMWEEAGLTDADIPETWDELIEVCKKMTKTDDAGNIVVAGFSYNGENNFVSLLQAMNYQKGVFQYTEDGSASLYSNPVVIENMNYLKSFYDEHKIGDNKGALNREAFGQGRAAVICDWTWVPSYITSTFPDIEMGVFPTPSFDGDPAAFDRNNGECSPCVSAKATDEAKAVAFDFVKYLLANDDFIRDFAMLNGIFPSKYSLDDDPTIAASPVHQALKATIDKTLWPGPVPSQIESIQGKYLQDDFLKNGVSAEDAARQTDEMMAKDLANLSFVPVERRYEGADRFTN
ncbi:MAG TPA: extracellular solute-binding protein [Candidatus Fournierella pullicola]|uniref:Extracellular solute-binding protein n=1 Tax=Candidatus Allofournierella pullicola TaxID=2838596 RepID=A0A9D1V4T8_9FIRM|nr:extracellular solute-binding protein [Candidatus Fournierella pullicola]